MLSECQSFKCIKRIDKDIINIVDYIIYPLSLLMFAQEKIMYFPQCEEGYS